MSEEPRFTDRQLALILKRAANLQAVGDESRHSLEEIRQIAAQVGIPPQLVTRAASEITEGRSPSGLFGPDTSYYATGTVPGRVEPRRYPDLLTVLRRRVKSPGQSGEIAGTLEWRGEARYYSLLVTVTPGERETVIGVQGEYARERNGIYAALVAGPTAVGLLAATFAMEVGRVPLAIAIFAGVGVLAYGTARVLWRYLARAGQREVRELRDALVEQLNQRE